MCFRTQIFEKSNKEIFLELYKIIAVPTFLYWCEDWTLLKLHERESETAEMTFLGIGARYVLGYMTIKQMNKYYKYRYLLFK
jgi:hypothetical protein